MLTYNRNPNNNIGNKIISKEVIRVRAACKYYSAVEEVKRRDVLIDLDMTVTQGTIYGLLGANGCGKTTLLSCIVGQRQLNSGEIWVLGGRPGTPYSGVPGPRIGYMPQDLALIEEFNIKETIYYFGKLLGTETDKLFERFIFLCDLLELLPDGRHIKNCSLEQQKRVSLAVALVHEPELLILDEPTVGVDPVLRDRIWNHLIEISKRNKTTIVISTHYVEETKQAQTIGLMRNGTLLTEENPEFLMSLFGTDTLEEVFLYLSERQFKGQTVPEFQSEEYQMRLQLRNEAQYSINDIYSIDSITEITSDDIQLKKQERPRLKLDRLESLIYKNWIQYTRNAEGIFFYLIFPLATIISFYIATGGDFKRIKMAVVNEESNWTNCQNYSFNNSTVMYDAFNNVCQKKMLSCRFLNSFNDTFLIKKFYSNVSSAKKAVHKGDAVGVMHFATNYSKSFALRLENGLTASKTDIENGQLNVWMDMSNYRIGSAIRTGLTDKYNEFIKGIYRECNQSIRLVQTPLLIVNPPVYGSKNYKPTIHMTPSLIMIPNFASATIVTSSILVTERLEGMWDRITVAGCTSTEILLSHLIIQAIMMSIQTSEIVLTVFVIFGIPCAGSVAAVAFILFVEGLTGMSFGLMISVLSPSRTASLALSSSIFMPITLTSGILWPIEGLPYPLQIIVKILPFTIPTNSVRNIMEKGWSISNLEVMDGCLVLFLWMLFFCYISITKLTRLV